MTHDFGSGLVPAGRHPNGGGWVADTAHVDNTAFVDKNAHVYGDANVYDDAHVYDNAHVYGDAHVYGNAYVSGNAKVSGDAQVYGNAHVYGDATVGHIRIDFNLTGNLLEGIEALLKEESLYPLLLNIHPVISEIIKEKLSKRC